MKLGTPPAFDTTAPTTIVSLDTAAVGTAAAAARRDHRHGAPLIGPTHTSGVSNVGATESTSSVTYTDLTTVGPSVTLSPGRTATHLIIVSTDMYNNTAGSLVAASVSIAGAGAVDGDAAAVVQQVASNAIMLERPVLASSVADGSTHTMKYRVAANTGTFSNTIGRRLVAFTLT